jgi:hypothetical protein
MAIIEQSTFNPNSYHSFTPKVTREHNNDVLSGLLIASIAVAISILVYYEATKQMEAKRKNIVSEANRP